MNPCIILPDYKWGCYDAYNEDGRLIGRRSTYSWLADWLFDNDYDPVPLNSRLGRTISDVVNNKTHKRNI